MLEVYGVRVTRARLVRRLSVLLAAIAVSSVVAPAHALADYPSPCTYADFNAPGRVAVVRQFTGFDSGEDLDSNCMSPFLSEKFSATWEAVAENGTVVDEVWFHTLSAPVTWDADPAMSVADSDHLGLWRWRPTRGFSDILPPYAEVTLTLQEMNSPTTDVRVGSAGRVVARRTGSKVTISTSSTRYWTSTHAFGPWSRAVGVIQYRTPGTTAWRSLKNVASDGYGRYSYTYTVSSRRDYRYIAFDKAPYIWGSISANVSTA